VDELYSLDVDPVANLPAKAVDSAFDYVNKTARPEFVAAKKSSTDGMKNIHSNFAKTWPNGLSHVMTNSTMLRFLNFIATSFSYSTDLRLKCIHRILTSRLTLIF
jgi:hypothetical protein